MMPNRQRCLDLIYQAAGSLDEKLACAQVGLWGNLPPLVNRTVQYSEQPLPPVARFDPVSYWRRTFVERGDSVRKCGNCNCGGNGGGGVLQPVNRLAAPAAAPIASYNVGARIGGSGFQVSAELGLGLAVVILAVMAFRKKG